MIAETTPWPRASSRPSSTRVFAGFDDTYAVLADYIDTFCDHHGLHSAHDYVSPVAVELRSATLQMTAEATRPYFEGKPKRRLDRPRGRSYRSTIALRVETSSEVLPAGTMVGEYRIEERIGEGGFGAVYRARHPLIAKDAAVKVLSAAYAARPEHVSRFLAEARAANQIGHPNIVDIFSFGRLEDGRHYFVMELIDGVSLRDWARAPLPLPEAIIILERIARALQAAHDHGIVHRDLKPANVLLSWHLRDVPDGGRRADAVEALAQLEPIAGTLEASGDLVPLDDTPPETRIVVTSPTPGARVALDGAAPQATPFTTVLTPGPHQVRVEAEGFVATDRNLQIPAEAVTALGIPLVAKPGRIRVDGPSGAQVTIDGNLQGILPLSESVRVDAGPHRVRVALSGHQDHTTELRLGRGEEAAVSADMPLTTQRYTAMGLLFGGGGLFAVGTGLGTVALVRQAQASSLKSDIDAGEVVCRGGVCPQLDDYNRAVNDRAVLGGTSIGFLVAGVAAGTGGLLLYLFDEPEADTGAAPPDDQDAAPPTPDGPSIELGSLAPVVTPEGGGLHLRGRF